MSDFHPGEWQNSKPMPVYYYVPEGGVPPGVTYYREIRSLSSGWNPEGTVGRGVTRDIRYYPDGTPIAPYYPNIMGFAGVRKDWVNFGYDTTGFAEESQSDRPLMRLGQYIPWNDDVMWDAEGPWRSDNDSTGVVGFEIEGRVYWLDDGLASEADVEAWEGSGAYAAFAAYTDNNSRTAGQWNDVTVDDFAVPCIVGVNHGPFVGGGGVLEQNLTGVPPSYDVTNWVGVPVYAPPTALPLPFTQTFPHNGSVQNVGPYMDWMWRFPADGEHRILWIGWTVPYLSQAYAAIPPSDTGQDVEGLMVMAARGGEQVTTVRSLRRWRWLYGSAKSVTPDLTGSRDKKLTRFG